MPGFQEGFSKRKPRASASILILSPKPGRPLTGILLGSVALTHEVHFDRSIGTYGKSVPCMGLPLCGYCRAGVGSNSKSFLAAAHVNGLTPFCLQLSEGAAEDMQALVGECRDWRGMIVVSSRTDTRKQSRQHVVANGWYEATGLPPAFDLRAVVERTWGLTTEGTTDTRTRSPRPATRAQHGRG